MNFKCLNFNASCRRILLFKTVPNITAFAIFFFVGCCGILFCRELPPVDFLLFMIAVLTLLSCKYPVFTILTVITLGYLWATVFAHQALSDQLLADFEKKRLNMTVNIVDFPKTNQSTTTFVAEVLRAQHDEIVVLQSKVRVRLSCYHCDENFALGDQFQIDAVLRRPRGGQSWGAFDFEKYAVSQGIAATGYIKKIKKKISLSERKGKNLLLLKYRQRIKQHLQENSNEKAAFSILSALSIGDRSAFTSDIWRVLRATGLTHIVSISGLHIGLIFLIFKFLSRKLLNLFHPIYLKIPANYLAAFLALICATFYASLAGFSLPTQRALIMLSIYFLCLFSPQKKGLITVLCLTVGVIMLIDPLAVLSSSFWLSASAVLLIGLAQLTRQRSVVYLQWFLSLAMAPLAIGFFSETSIISPIVNLIVVPLVSFLVLPVLFLSLLLIEVIPLIGCQLLWVLSQGVNFAWECLLWIENEFTVASVKMVFDQWVYAICLFFILMVALWSILPNKRFVLLLVLFAALLKPDKKVLTQGEFVLTVLDVGQGLAVVIETPNGTSIFDTGTRYGDVDSAQRVIIPYLQHQGVKRLQSVVVSHLDSDHVGGLNTLLQHYSHDRLLIAEKMDFDLDKDIQQETCQRGAVWHESGVKFEMLAPEVGVNQKNLSRNNGSCVLLIKSPWGSVLLPGDIEREVEHQLVARFGRHLDVDALVLAHHGSLTSSSPAFLQMVKPSIAIASSGYLSRHGHPHSKVVFRIQKMHAKLLNTATSGSIRIRFSKSGLQMTEFRAMRRRFWYAID